MKYYFCEKSKIACTIDNQYRLKVYKLEDSGWQEVSIAKTEQSSGAYEHVLNYDNQNIVTLTIPGLNTQVNYLTVKFLPNILLASPTFYNLPLVTPISFEAHTKKAENSGSPSEPLLKKEQNTVKQKVISSNISTQTYSLTEQQREKLQAHKAMLEKRWFDYRLFSYLSCGDRGYSRSQKIEEINKLLNGKAADSAIVEQGRTGSILKSS